MKSLPSLLRCRISRKQLARLVTPALAFVPFANAADVFKANNADALNLTTSWTSGALPTSSDVAVFDSTVTSIAPDVETGFSYMQFPAAASWQGVRVSGAVDKLSIDSFGLGLPALTIGSAGLDFSAATAGTTFEFFGQTITLGAFQTWNIADGATVLFSSGALSRAQGVTLKINLGATGTGIINPTTTFGAANANLIYATVGGGDFAAVNGTQTALVPGATLGTYAPNPNTGAAVGNIPATTNQSYGVIDVVNSNTTAASTAFRVNANFFVGGIRFNTANANGADWNVDGTGTTRNINIGNGSILVGPNVGAFNVNFNGASQFRMGTNAEFYIHQFNTQADLVLNNPMNQSNGTGSRLTKDGPGRLILAGSNTLGGQTTILEGTVQIGNGGTTGTLNNGAVVNHGTLVFNRTNDYTAANVISGSGLLRKEGAGTLTLSGANTYTGATEVVAGSVNFASPGSLGAGTEILLAGGGLVWGAGNTGDISDGRTVTFGSGGTTLNTNGNDVTLGNSIGNNGVGGVTKTGAGVLTLGGANLYSGDTAVAAGGLAVTNTVGSATGSGNVSLANTTVLSGSGTIAGAVTLASGAKLVPGTGGVGTLTTGGLSLASGALLDLEFASTSSYDQVIVTNSNGLNVDGGDILLYTAGGTTPWATTGTYDLIQYSGTLGGVGVGSLNVLNNQPGYSYTFTADGATVKLQIALDSILTQWNAAGGGSWADIANWSNGVAAANYTAQFTTDLGAPATVTLDGARFSNGLSFASSGAYTIAAGSGGSLTLERGSGNVGATILSGNHVISAPVVLNSTLSASVADSASLTLSGVVSGVGGVVKSGPGTLDLTGSNTFSGAVNVVGGVLGFASGSSLGTGDITLNGGALRYDTGNTDDISSKVLNFGLNGATIDTNGNSVTLANPVGNSGIGSFTKAGLGTLTLSGANTYTGQTFVTGGTLAFSANGNFGSESTGAGLTVDGAVLAPTATVSLDNAGANARSIAVGANGAELNVATGLALTIPGLVSGSGSLTKTGEGELVLTGANTGFSGAVSLAEGDVRFGSNTANGQSGLGSGTITFGDGAHLYLNGYQTLDAGTTFGVMSNALVVPENVAAHLHLPQRGGYSGVASGSGTLNLSVDGIRSDVNGAWPAFTGQLNVVKTPTGEGTEFDDYRMVAAQNLSAARVSFGAGVQVYQTFNPPSDAVGTTHQFGQLTVAAGAILGGNPVGGRYNNYSIGALNTDSVIDGQIVGTLGTFGYGYPRITKVGTGMLTITGTNHMVNTGAATNTITVSAGTLNLLGSIERFYLGIGADGVYGRDTTSLLTDDTISNSPPATEYQNLEPGAMVVAEGATLTGNGRFGGITTVNGTLRPDSTGTLEGRLAFTNAATLALSTTATTQFDFNGDKYTGVQVDAANGLTYGGALRINFLTTVPNLSKTLFLFTGSYGGSFGSVTVIADSAENTLNDVGGGVFTATVGSITYTFTSATGVFEVSGAGPTLTALQSWRQQYSLPVDGSGLGADSADPDNDGIANLIEYATGTIPTEANAPVVVQGLSGGKLTLTFRRIDDPALTYTVEGRDDLTTGNWATVDTIAGNNPINGFAGVTPGVTETESVTVIDSVTLTSQSKRFLHLKVSY